MIILLVCVSFFKKKNVIHLLLVAVNVCMRALFLSLSFKNPTWWQTNVKLYVNLLNNGLHNNFNACNAVTMVTSMNVKRSTIRPYLLEKKQRKQTVWILHASGILCTNETYKLNHIATAVTHICVTEKKMEPN